ncbi:YebC/PmpR family DNA-binding transcriptional regulator [Brumimicrobium glaciale]|uniref:Probable transcriptional regulatory protein ERX46_09805 n=1 Tax=Brumimicrobium glaciale TaxID=200475 RepID=A0A4Q4KQE4_9FLAO|nr:YebC/PmpR family DNA-binding transcriptional regulator [Brumimicrobium glaciale]RYM34239.1 YebC/PmpR family DNA-binding transcriptional regulator [Brumimicrobium glaciale]
MGRAFEVRRASKEKRSGAMSKLFPKLLKVITMAAKEGGEDPAMNSTLRSAIQNAKAKNVPKDNIEKAIKRAQSKDVENYELVNYEGKAPHGVLMYVECATDNTTRTVANVKSYFNKAGGQIVPNGSIEFMFDRKAVFEIEKSEGLDIEELELEFIDAGLAEIEQDEEGLITIYGDYTSFGTLQTALEEKNIEVSTSGLKRFSTAPIHLDEDETLEIEKLLDKIEDDDDIQQVFTNIE